MSKEHEALKASFSRLFKTHDGQVVLEYLTKTYFNCSIKSDTAIRQLGRRDVVQTIINKAESEK